MEFSSPTQLPRIPDDLSIPQFILNTDFAKRPARSLESVPYFIEDITGDRVYFAEAHRRTFGLANALNIKWNIGNDDVVCIFSPNHVDYAIAVWAVHSLGGIITPANPNYTDEELTHQLMLTKAAFIMVHPSFLAVAQAASRNAGIPEDRIALFSDDDITDTTNLLALRELIDFGSSRPQNYAAQRFKPAEGRTKLAFLSFSSGTTGKPKAVAISHYAVIANVIQMATHQRVTDENWKEKRLNPGDIAIAVLPFFHIYGLVVIMHFLLYCGMSLVVVPKFKFSEFLKSISKHRVTHLYLVPPQVVLLCKSPLVKDYNFDHIKFCNSGAAPLSGELMSQLSAIFPNAAIGQGYGLTETSTTLSSHPPDRKLGIVGSAGQLLPGVVARVVKEDGSLAAEGEQGELVVKSPSAALRYYNNPAATKETFVDGWVRTGDEVVIRDLQVYVVDRLKEIMKVRGFQVAPAELEGHLLLHPDVVDACVVGVPDDYSGELPLAFVVLKESAAERVKKNSNEAAEIKKAIAKHVSDVKVAYKWLAGGIEFVEVIPKNPSGKILRRVLREKARALRRAEKAKL